MRIAIIGPGIMHIPPRGWGAVESLIWDYYVNLIKIGHDVTIINDSNPSNIIEQANQDFDVVHIQYDEWVRLAESIKCKTILATSHYAYLEQEFKHGGYTNIFNEFLKNNKINIFSLSEGIKNTYIRNGFPENRIFVVPNGVETNLFSFSDTPEDKSIYLAKIDYRKSQYKYHNIENLYFAGNIADERYNKNNYLGEWSKKNLYKNLTNFSNLVLLSDGEAHPLVCMEAMAAGLGLVISSYATANLDLTKAFIDVIPDDKLNDIEYVEKTIVLNREKSRKLRKEIKDYAFDNFDWKKIINKTYLKNIETLI